MSSVVADLDGLRAATDVLVADVVATAEALDASWPAGGSAVWEGHGLTLGGPLPVAEMPFRRRREVEIHRVDLGLAFPPDDWSDAYVARELEVARARSAERTADGRPVEVGDDDARHVLAWLLGRADAPAGRPALAPWAP